MIQVTKIKELKEYTLRQVLDYYGVNLKKAGRLLKGLCPLHDDKRNPNFFYYPETDSFYCFSCLKGGNSMDFISYMEHIPKQKIHEIWTDNNAKIAISLNKKEIQFKEIDYMLLSLLAHTLLKKNVNNIYKLKEYDNMFYKCTNYKKLYDFFVREYTNILSSVDKEKTKVV